jgi:3-hydroxyisobutyrate dehydrogenase-like beta-hydroxyacid dehydrogenase
METIAWFGAGLMGSGFVEALRRRGSDVVVYNRTFEKARALERFGARAAGDPREAARGARRLHLMVADDAAVDALLESLDGAIEPGAVVIDHSTVAPLPTKTRFERMASRGVGFLHAPVLMSPQAAREGGGLMMVSGPQAVFAEVEAELSPMAAHLWYLGERPEKAAALKLCGNQMLFFIVAGLADIYATARAAGVTPHEAFELFSHFKPGGALEWRGKKMADGDFAAAFELTMARKDVRLMLETAAAGRSPLHVLPAIAARMDELIASGRGGDDLAVLGVDSR